MTPGPDRALWFDGRHGGLHEGSDAPFLGRFDLGGTLTEFPLPGGRTMGAPVAGPGGDLWFPETFENRSGYLVARIGRMSTSGALREYRLGDHVGTVSAMAATGGSLWFAAERWIDGELVPTIGRLTKASPGPVMQFRLEPRCGSGSMAAAGAVLWFTETCRRKTKGGRIRHTSAIGRIGPRGGLSRQPLPPGFVTESIATGPRADVWFGVQSDGYSGSRFGHMTPGRALREFRAPDGAAVGEITVGPEGRLWFATSYGGEFVRALDSIGPGGDISRPICAASPCDQEPRGLTTGPDGALWYSGSKLYSTQGGGGSLIAKQMEIEDEAGIVGRLILPA